MMPFLVNPRPRRRKRRFSAKQLAAQRKFAAKYGGGAGKARRSRVVTRFAPERGATKMAVRKRRKATVRRKPRRRSGGAKRRRSTARSRTHFTGRGRVTFTNPRRRRGHRRNPAFSVSGIGGRLVQAAQTATGVLGGEIATTYFANMIPFGGTSTVAQVGKRAVVGVGVAFAADKVLGRRWGDAVLVGALLSPIRQLLAGVPGVGNLVSGGVSSYYSMPRMSSYYLPGSAGLPLPAPTRVAQAGVATGMGQFPGAEYSAVR
jgi:hypothetical protein